MSATTTTTTIATTKGDNDEFARVAEAAAWHLAVKAQPLASKAKPQARTFEEVPGGRGHFYGYGLCVFYALYNLAAVYQADASLRVVIGSLGVGRVRDRKPVHFDWGDAKWTQAQQFIIDDGRSTNLHVWLENTDGRVYDVLSEEFLGIAFLHGRTTSLLSANPELIEAASKTTMALRGFSYVPAPLDTQRELWRHMIKQHAKVFAQLALAVPAELNAHAPRFLPAAE